MTPPIAGAGTVLITGGSRGLGLELARRYATRGWAVIAAARDPGKAHGLQELAAGSERVTVERLDLLDRRGIAALAAKYHGTPIDVLVNNAAVLGDLRAQTLGSFEYAAFEETFAVNVYGALALCEAFCEHVAASRQKKMVAITSGSGIISLPGWRGPYFYRASKIALNMVMRVLAEDLRSRGVIVGVLAPGTMDTDMRRELVGAETASRDRHPADVAAALIDVIERLDLTSSGVPVNVDGSPMPW